jgi:hypothetical protein
MQSGHDHGGSDEGSDEPGSDDESSDEDEGLDGDASNNDVNDDPGFNSFLTKKRMEMMMKVTTKCQSLAPPPIERRSPNVSDDEDSGDDNSMNAADNALGEDKKELPVIDDDKGKVSQSQLLLEVEDLNEHGRKGAGLRTW